MGYLKQAFEMNKFDAEIILNMVELYILQHQRKHAQRYIKYYYDHTSQLQYFDKSKEQYDEKILLFQEYIVYQLELKETKKKK